MVRVRWYSYTHERLTIAEDGNPVRVMCGEFQREETLRKNEAVQDPRFSRFFNVKGHFKQFSAMR